MKKLLLSAAASIALTAALGGVAHADATTKWTVNNTKTTVITEFTTINKTETVTVTDVKPLDGMASALALVNSTVEGDTVGVANVPSVTNNGVTIPAFLGDGNNFDIHRTATIVDSVEHNTGIGQVNQDVGNNSNQGNVIAAAFVFDATDTSSNGGTLAKAEAYVEQLSEFNSSTNIEDGAPTVKAANGSPVANPNLQLVKDPNFGTTNATPETGYFLPQIEATISDSFNSNTGVFMGNQNAGNNNEQHNALAAAIGDNTFTALSDAGLHQVNKGNKVVDVNTVKEDVILHAVNNNSGIVMVNQATGDNNNQATVVSVAAISSFVALP
ncbi:MAG: hypothetical protein ACHP84_11345 [Caulobacterales bacterium]